MIDAIVYKPSGLSSITSNMSGFMCLIYIETSYANSVTTQSRLLDSYVENLYIQSYKLKFEFNIVLWRSYTEKLCPLYNEYSDSLFTFFTKLRDNFYYNWVEFKSQFKLH